MLKLSALILAFSASVRSLPWDGGSIAFVFASLPLCALALSFSYLHFRRITPLYPLQRHKNDDAADIPEQSAALAPFQRHQPSIPPCKNVNSAASPVLPAGHFSGISA